MTHRVEPNLPLTSKQKFRFGLAWPDLDRPERNLCFDVNGRFGSTRCVTLYLNDVRSGRGMVGPQNADDIRGLRGFSGKSVAKVVNGGRRPLSMVHMVKGTETRAHEWTKRLRELILRQQAIGTWVHAITKPSLLFLPPYTGRKGL